MVTPIQVVEELMKQAAEILSARIKYNLSYLGLVCVRRIRDRSGIESWFDQTGNLRSSIGYAIYSQGRKEIESAFDSVLGASDGPAKGKKLIADLATQYSDTYALVVVAAMEYAERVEALETKDVLASTEIYAKQEVGRYLQKAVKEATLQIQKLQAAL
jgi:hypothetical protein